MRSLDLPCGEQGKLPTAKAFKPAERDKTMSEREKPSFMQELDQWTDANIIIPLFNTEPNPEAWEQTGVAIKKSIREKVLESYRNGLKAKPRTFPQPKGNR